MRLGQKNFVEGSKMWERWCFYVNRVLVGVGLSASARSDGVQILNYFYSKQYQSYVSKSIIIKMQTQINHFLQMTNIVNNSLVFNQILQKQQNKYDLQPYKIDNCETESLLKLYQGILNKYQITKELTLDSNNWNQNQRRLFVWFIICYTHYHELDNSFSNQKFWNELSLTFFHKKPQFLHFQYLNLIKCEKRVAWTAEEDQLLVQCIQSEKPGKWNQISKKIFFNSNHIIFRTPKHCRERWLNHLDTNKKHGQWSTEEDQIVFTYVLQNGKRWSKIVPLLNETRTEHMIKNRYNSVIRKTRTSKKQKEEDTVRKILKQLSKSIEQDNSEQRSHQQRTEPTVVQSQMVENTENNSNSPSQQLTPSLVPATYPQPYNYFVDFNQFLLMNQFYYQQQNYYNQPLIGIQMDFPLSKQSNFSRYTATAI